MNKLLIIITFFLLGCNHLPKPEDTKLSRSKDMQDEINKILAKDAENKKLEREILEEIRIAQENQDEDAFKFFLQDYMRVERLKIPEWMKEEPNYVQGGLKVKY
tara:strand:+ start:3272 stop:3583 length:312 start_codon:yes stop_codon:yes gene_type:complete